MGYKVKYRMCNFALMCGFINASYTIFRDEAKKELQTFSHISAPFAPSSSYTPTHYDCCNLIGA